MALIAWIRDGKVLVEVHPKFGLMGYLMRALAILALYEIIPKSSNKTTPVNEWDSMAFPCYYVSPDVVRAGSRSDDPFRRADAPFHSSARPAS